MPVAAKRRPGSDVDEHPTSAAGHHMPGGGAIAVKLLFRLVASTSSKASSGYSQNSHCRATHHRPRRSPP